MFNCVKFNRQLSGRFHVWFILNVNCLGKFLILKVSQTELICWILMFAYLPMQVVIMDYCHFNLVWDLRSFDVTSDNFCLTTHKHSLYTVLLTSVEFTEVTDQLLGGTIWVLSPCVFWSTYVDYKSRLPCLHKSLCETYNYNMHKMTWLLFLKVE